MAEQSVILFVSNRCNLECRFCFEAGQRIAVMPTLEEIREKLLGSDPATVQNVMFMGAETLLRKDAREILGTIRDMGFRGIGVATNGTMIDTPERLIRLIDAGLEYLELSVHSLVPERAAFLSGRAFLPARQRRCLAVINEVKAERALAVSINTVVVRANVADVVGIMTGIERDFPAIRPRYFVKNAVPTSTLVARDELASWADVRVANLVGNIPAEVRDRVVIADMPLCLLAPHFELSGNLVGFVHGDHYWYVDERQQRDGTEADTLSAKAATFAPECAPCSLRAICCGVGGHAVASGDVTPSDASDVDVVRYVARCVRDRGLTIADSVASDPEGALEPLRRRTSGSLVRPAAGDAVPGNIDDFRRILLAGELPLEVGGGARVVALRAPPGRARFELDVVDGTGVELTVHVEQLREGVRSYVSTRLLALSHQPANPEIPGRQLDRMLRGLATYLAAHETSTPPDRIAALFAALHPPSPTRSSG